MRIGNISVSNVGNKLQTSDYKKYTGLSKKEISSLIALARKGASIGEYMGDNTGGNFIREYVKKNVTPDYSAIKSHIIGSFKRNQSLGMTRKDYCGNYSNYSFNCQMGMFHNYAVVFDILGREILRYDSRNGWWQPSNAEEKKAYKEMTAIYYEAYTEARAEMREQGFLTEDGETLPGFDPTTGIEMPAPIFDTKT